MNRAFLILALIASGLLPVQAEGNYPHAEEIRKLIEQLAISDNEATMAPVYTPGKDTPKTDKRVIAYDAAEKLRSFGPEALPYLLEHLSDKRQSVAFRRVLPSTVGDACYTLITRLLYALPVDYRGSLVRLGKDGKTHERPVFSRDLFTADSLKTWLDERKGKSLEELQIEALGWVLAEEERIGAATSKDEKEILDPLRAKLSELREKAVNRSHVQQALPHEP